MVREALVERDETGRGVVKHETAFGVDAASCEFASMIGKPGRGDQDLCAAVIEDVIDFRRRQVGRDRRDPQSGAQAAPDQRQILRAVFEQDGEAIALVETELSHQMRETVRGAFECAEGDCLPAVGLDHRRFVRVDRRHHARMLDLGLSLHSASLLSRECSSPARENPSRIPG